jgi:hypothetical protein
MQARTAARGDRLGGGWEGRALRHGTTDDAGRGKGPSFKWQARRARGAPGAQRWPHSLERVRVSEAANLWGDHAVRAPGVGVVHTQPQGFLQRASARGPRRLQHGREVSAGGAGRARRLPARCARPAPGADTGRCERRAWAATRGRCTLMATPSMTVRRRDSPPASGCTQSATASHRRSHC